MTHSTADIATDAEAPASPLGPLGWLDAAQQATRTMAKGQAALRAVLARSESPEPLQVDPLNVSEPFSEVAAKLVRHPGYLLRAEFALWREHVRLGARQIQKAWVGEAQPVVEPERSDRRFRHPSWTENLFFDTVKQSYLLTSTWLRETLSGVEGLDDVTRKRVDFYVRQLVNGLAPTNFALTNPEVVAKTVETGGQNLLRGLENLLDDITRGKGRLAVRMTDETAFEVGRDVATTPGKVVFQTPLVQLIQFAPSTERVRKTPLLIVPPWINKYYILDLRPDNSLVRWAVDQGHTVFVLSWVNPDRSLAHKSFGDYLSEGTLAALGAIERITGETRVNAIGYCLGGTLLACTLGYLAAADPQRIASATFLASLTDFSEAGDIRIFIDEKQVAAIEERMKNQGYLDAPAMAFSFNSLRENDLVWSHVVHNYLMGEQPVPFDLLFWNSDSTRMPAAMHAFYLRKMYLENKLVAPGGLELLGVPIDLRRVTAPVFLLSLAEDHIAPWRATYAATQLYAGPKAFVLGGSGHIAGVINPPGKAKYGYWTNESLPPSPDAWLEGAQQHQGSWWNAWEEWVSKTSGKADVPARVPGVGPLPALEDAPGAYVRSRV